MSNRFPSKPRWLLLFALALALGVAGSTRAGGWAVLSLDEWPAAVVEQPVTVAFKVRQHGQHLASGLSAVVMAEHAESRRRLSVPATALKEQGHYEATLTFPEAGLWTWEIDAFGQHRLPPLTVQPVANVPTTAGVLPVGLPALTLAAAAVAILGGAGGLFVWSRTRRRSVLGLALTAMVIGAGFIARPAANTVPAHVKVTDMPASESAEMGEMLFVAKGCIMCHQHAAFGDHPGMAFGPNLTYYKPEPAFVREWLRDPAAIRPETFMPNLELSDGEMEALIAFLAADNNDRSLREE